MATILRFVDSIQVTPVIRLDLNDGQTWAASEETVFGPPAMKRSVTSTMLRDGEYVGATAYGNRELELVLKLFATGNAAATQLQAFQRELDRPMNLLQYTIGEVTNTVFFRTFRSSPNSVRFDPLLKEVRVTVLAEPFAIGLREDISPITINNNPAAGSNGLFADLTGIKGDVETPLFIEYADGAAGLQRSGFAIGVRSGASPYPNRFHQAEAMSMVLDTSVVADATFSGGSKARCTFATVPADTVRVLANFPALTDPAGAENWGVFRVFARVAQTVAGDVITMKVRTAGDYNRPVTIKSQTQPQMVDLGTLDSTLGVSTVGGYGVAEYRIEDQAGIFVNAGRVSGSGSLDIDYIAFVPADECFGAWAAFLDVTNTTDLGVVDGVNDAAYIASTLTGGTPGRGSINNSSIQGRLPRVMPGSNRLVIVESTKGQAAPTSNLLTTSITMTIRYWPRYLLVRPVAT